MIRNCGVFLGKVDTPMYTMIKKAFNFAKNPKYNEYQAKKSILNFY